MIIFERLNRGAGSTELWPVDPGMPESLNARRIGLAPGGGDASNPVAYKALPRSAWKLGELTQRLRRSRNFRPHVHLAWRQQMVAPERAQPIYIEMMDKRDARNRIDGMPKLEGTIKVGIKRYLHFETDLLLRRLNAESEIQAYRLQTNRRMRSGPLYYLDHPVFGVLVQASRYQPPAPPPPEPEPAPSAPESGSEPAANTADPAPEQPPTD